MLIIDAHVHIYDCFDMELFYDSAYANFLKQATRLKKENDFCGVLLLAERAGQNTFCHLAESLKQNKETKIGHWKVARTDEPFTLKLTNPADEVLFLVQGRQLNSKEGLEVLSLIADVDMSENLPLADLVKEISHHQSIAVIPWAFGKWLGRRGRILRSFINQEKNQSFFLGDNGGRPLLFFSRLLSEHKEKTAFKIVSGSDPLPLRKEECRVGNFGVYVETTAEITGIGRQIYKLLQNPDAKFFSYGKSLSIWRCLYNQYLLRKTPMTR